MGVAAASMRWAQHPKSWTQEYSSPVSSPTTHQNPSFYWLCPTRQDLNTQIFSFCSTPSRPDDTAPKERKSLWLAALFLCITLGFALGFVVGGVAGLRFGWRAVLAGEAIGMLPFAMSLLLAADVPRRAHSAPSRAQAEQRGAWHEAWVDLRALLSLPIACLTILGLCLFVGALGTLSFYGRSCCRGMCTCRVMHRLTHEDSWK